MTENILVVAFDGMDRELIEEFDLENIPQEEFGGIDDNSGVYRRMTSELFASFITGETYEEHGVKGLIQYENSRNAEILEKIVPLSIVDKYRGLRTLRDMLEAIFDPGERLKYTKEDIKADTLFEKIDASLPLYVPNYSPDVHWLIGNPHDISKYYRDERFVNEARRMTERRLHGGTSNQPGFFDVTKDFWDFIILHLHDPEGFQDLGIGDFEEDYKRLDEIAGEILEEYGDDWTVIFMSDHGRPERENKFKGHNRNAFYSCNRELFGDKTPHITDFHDKILELTGNEDEL